MVWENSGGRFRIWIRIQRGIPTDFLNDVIFPFLTFDKMYGKKNIRKARAAIRRYWHEKGERKEERVKKYNTTLWISLPDKPGQLGNVSSLIGEHKLNISNLVMAGKNPNYINFKFQLIIRDLKNFTNFIAELKQKGIKFKIIRHEDKRNAFTQKILRYFKKN